MSWEAPHVLPPTQGEHGSMIAMPATAARAMMEKHDIADDVPNPKSR